MAAEGQTGSKMLDEMPEYRIFELLKKYHYTLTTAESATGGMIASNDKLLMGYRWPVI